MSKKILFSPPKTLVAALIIITIGVVGIIAPLSGIFNFGDPDVTFFISIFVWLISSLFIFVGIFLLLKRSWAWKMAIVILTMGIFYSLVYVPFVIIYNIKHNVQLGIPVDSDLIFISPYSIKRLQYDIAGFIADIFPLLLSPFFLFSFLLLILDRKNFFKIAS